MTDSTKITFESLTGGQNQAQDRFSALSAEDIRFVVNLAVRAGAIAVSMRQGVKVEEKTSATDLVTCADKALSDLIMKELQDRFPGDLVLSEEAPWVNHDDGRRRWIIDPIDGTKYYVDNTGKYCVMIGLEHQGRSLFGCFFMPAYKQVMFGAPELGAYRILDVEAEKVVPETTEFGRLEKAPSAAAALPSGRPVRVLLSKNDLAVSGWLKDFPGVELVTATSIGIDVFELSNGIADVFVKVRPTLGYWDTAAPVPVAQAMGFEVGTEVQEGISYGYDNPRHASNVVIGAPGSLAWWRQTLAARPVEDTGLAATANAPVSVPVTPVVSAPAADKK